MKDSLIVANIYERYRFFFKRSSDDFSINKRGRSNTDMISLYAWKHDEEEGCMTVSERYLTAQIDMMIFYTSNMT
jgi:hypothetical protein